MMYGDGYDLVKLGVPRNAWPQPDKPNKGIHSYTVSKAGKVIEVLLQKQAFYVRGDGNPDFQKGTSTQSYSVLSTY